MARRATVRLTANPGAAERSAGAPANRRLTRGQRNAEWIEKHLRVPEGKFVGKPLKLTTKQRKWLCDIYDSPTRTFILSMGRKNAKTAFAAMLLLLHLCGPEAQANSQLYSAAQSKEQAAVTYELAAKMVRMSEELSTYVRIRDTVKEMMCPEIGTFYKALSAEVSTSFGKSPIFVIHDELGQVKGARSLLYEAMETAMAAHEVPLSVVISTQASTDADLLSLLIDDALTGADPRNKVVLYSAPMDMDPFSDEAIRASNPHFDDFMNQEEVRRTASEAKRMPSKEAGYRNLNLNQRIEADNPFVTRAVWQGCGVAPTVLIKAPRPVGFGGLDLSSVNDLTALVMCDPAGNRAFNVRPTFWLPQEGIDERSRNDRVPYNIWAQQGFLNLTPGPSIEYEFVAHYIKEEVWPRYDMRNGYIAFDRYNWKFLKPWLIQAGFTEWDLGRFVEFGQGYVSMSPAMRELESKLLQKELLHGNHPLLAMCAANATVTNDPAGNRKFVKMKARGRIDGMVALAMAVGVMPTVAAPSPSLLVL